GAGKRCSSGQLVRWLGDERHTAPDVVPARRGGQGHGCDVRAGTGGDLRSERRVARRRVRGGSLGPGATSGWPRPSYAYDGIRRIPSRVPSTSRSTPGQFRLLRAAWRLRDDCRDDAGAATIDDAPGEVRRQIRWEGGRLLFHKRVIRLAEVVISRNAPRSLSW